MTQASIITIGGDPGSGKTTVAMILAFKTGFTRLYAGGIQRELCKNPKYNPEGLDFQKWLAQLPTEIDLKVDEEMKTAAQTKERIILDSRMAFNFVLHGKPALKVYLSVNPEVGAKRIFEQKKQNSKIRSEEKPYNSVEEAMEDSLKRKQQDTERYLKLYKVNPYDTKHYDLIIDTSYQTPEEVAEQILNAAELGNEIIREANN